MIWTVAKKELRGYFNSAVAVIFLAAFLAVTFYTFFWHEKFFARGLADLRPLFNWMPILLIILVSALAMRMWADERRAGTLEILLTLPVPRWKLVLGKFVAGLLLIAVGLALTLELPITVAKMGNLDTGPVIGGYLAALLLSGAYLAIGMCVSTATDNQIVAFVGTAALCAVAYAVGAVGFTGDVGQFLGTGVRFESVARGVVDMRDLAYYGSIMAIGIALNVLLLGLPTRGKGKRARARRFGELLGVGLVIANAVALNLWLAPVTRARIDLTETGAYSLSSSTKSILKGLDEPLVIRAYLSEKTHPVIQPLIPQLRDLLEEYRIAGGERIRVEIVDPIGKADDMRDAKERYDIKPRALEFATDTGGSVVNAYFAIAIVYGDQHVVLGLDELIQDRMTDIGKLEVTLKNPEYQITKGIKKVVSEFASLDNLFASLPGQIKLTAYLTPKTLPERWKDAPEKLKKVTDELVKDSRGKLVFATVEPKIASKTKAEAESQEAQAEALALVKKYGIRPMQELFADQVYYFYLVLEAGDRVGVVQLPDELGDAALKTAIVNGLKRTTRGFTKVVAIWSPPGQEPMRIQGLPPQGGAPPPQTFQNLQRSLSGTYEVRSVTLDAKLGDDVDVLVLAGPANLDAKAVEAVDQFVMRGGALVVLAGRYRLAPSQTGIAIEQVTTGLEAVLKKWGIKVGDEYVMDEKSDVFPMQQMRDVGNGELVPEVVQLPYPAFVKMTGSQLSSTNVITSALAGSVMHWASPITADAKVGDDEHRVDTLLESSGRSWLTKSTAAERDLQAYPETGFPPPASEDKRGSQVLGVAIQGGFASGVAKADDKAAGAGASAGAGSAGKPPLLEHSPPDTRIVVLGSSAFASDDLIEFSRRRKSDLALSNVELVHNAVDWVLADTDLLAIRAHTQAARALTIDPDAHSDWRAANIVIAAVALALVVVLAWLRRRAVRPFVAAKEV